jgi:predicted nucleic acid-binding protein
MQVFDASSMIYAWDNYPVRQLPGLWEWMAEQIEQRNLVMPNVAFEEVAHKTPDCSEWLKANDLKRLQTTNAVLHEAMRVKGLLGITDDNYHPHGVGENDILIIATARIHGGELVSDEKKQPTLPKGLSRFNIPAVCSMPEVAVACVNFLDFIKSSNQVFR